MKSGIVSVPLQFIFMFAFLSFQIVFYLHRLSVLCKIKSKSIMINDSDNISGQSHFHHNQKSYRIQILFRCVAYFCTDAFGILVPLSAFARHFGLAAGEECLLNSKACRNQQGTTPLSFPRNHRNSCIEERKERRAVNERT